jgi:hypothetical protein
MVYMNKAYKKFKYKQNIRNAHKLEWSSWNIFSSPYIFTQKLIDFVINKQ